MKYINWLKKSFGRGIMVFSIIISLVWACFVILDILAYLKGTISSVTIYLKGLASLLCTGAALFSWMRNQYKTQDLLRWLGFLLAFLGDIAVLLNTYKVFSAPIVFAIGGYLFIPALLLISIRNASFFKFLIAEGRFVKSRIVFGLYFYMPFLLLLIFLGKSLNKVGLLGLGIGYGLCLVTVLWTGWSSLKYQIHKRNNALIAIGASLVFIMELIGLIYNLHVKGLEEIAFFATWVIYIPGMLLMAIA